VVSGKDPERATGPEFSGFPGSYRKRKETRKLERRGDREARLVYICHAFRADPAGNAERVRRICEQLKHHCVPLAPHLLLPGFIDEATERDLALQHCMRLVAACDEVRVYGAPTHGMQLEIAEASRLGVPVVVVDDGQERRPPGRDLEAGSGRVRPC
jgi:hypothetical protein